MGRLRQFVIGLLVADALMGVLHPSPANADAFTVTEWGYLVMVDSGWPDVAGEGFSIVANPFVDQHSVTLPSNPATFAAAQYDISWLLDYGSFEISAQLAAQDGSSVRSLASGTVYMQSDSDLVLTLDSALSYSLPTYGLYAYLGFSVRDLTIGQTLFGTTQMYDSLTGPPAAGSLGITTDVILPAGHQFRVQYQSTLDTFGYSSGLATASGHTHWTLASIPEPATLMLLAPLPLALMRRRVRWTVGGRRTQTA